MKLAFEYVFKFEDWTGQSKVLVVTDRNSSSVRCFYKTPASFSFNFSIPTLFPNLSKNRESTEIHFSSS